MNCLHCTAETSNGLALCETCRAVGSVYLEFFPVYYRNLDRWRPGRSGRQVPGSREPQGPPSSAPDRITRALDEAGNALTAWAKLLTEDRGIEPPTSTDDADQVALTCRWLAENMTTIATMEWCGEFLRIDYDKDHEGDGIGYHHNRLMTLTEDVIPGWYAGACHLCNVGTYVVPGLSWVTCGGCGATTYARDHLETLLDEARGWVARPMRLAEAVVALVDTEQSVPRLHKRISKWGERERITSIRKLDDEGDPVGPKRFRLGEVLDALEVDGATRLLDLVDAKAS